MSIVLAAAMSMASLSVADEKAAFLAAGFRFDGKQWHSCARPGGPGYQPGFVQIVHDLNRDGAPEAILTERSAGCFGKTGVGYWVVSKQANGSWKLIAKGVGTARPLLDSIGVANWPDLEIAGPGTCFPVLRWNGRAYVLNRRASGGQPCR